MTEYVLITATGSDRPGLVDEISEYLAERNINIEKSRMAVLGGEFAIILLASGDEQEIGKLVDYPAGLVKNTGLQAQVKKTDPPGKRQRPASLPYRIRTEGMDHPGIVHDVSRTLHSYKVNIESMDTRVVPAPVSGTPMFTLDAMVSVPADVRVKKLKQALEELGDDLNMDIEFEPIEVP